MARKRLPPNDPREWLNCAAKQPGPGSEASGSAYLEDYCFDAQQAAEKAIKSVFMAYGLTFPFVHDLGRLLGLLRKVEFVCPSTSSSLTALHVTPSPRGIRACLRRFQGANTVALCEPRRRSCGGRRAWSTAVAPEVARSGVFGRLELRAGKWSWTGERFVFNPHFSRRATGLLHVGNRGADCRLQRVGLTSKEDGCRPVARPHRPIIAAGLVEGLDKIVGKFGLRAQH